MIPIDRKANGYLMEINPSEFATQPSLIAYTEYKSLYRGKYVSII